MRKIEKLYNLLKTSDIIFTNQSSIFNKVYDDSIKLLVLNILKENINKWVRSEYLILELPDLKYTLRVVINDLRQEGHPIVSSRKGYKYTEDKDEIILCISRLKHRSDEMMKAANGLLKNI